MKTPSFFSGSSESASICFMMFLSFTSFPIRGCLLAMLMNVAPKRVSCLVVKIFIASSEPATLKSTSTPSLRPIQLRCMAITLSGQPVRESQSFNSSSAYAVILRNHCLRSFCVTLLSHLQHKSFTTCSLARTVSQDGHQLTKDAFLYASPLSNILRKNH